VILCGFAVSTLDLDLFGYVRVKYGFVIDNRRCIGCHACTVACKAEHEVPLGKFRTWVKNVEKGSFPDVRRYFTVLRCNHCDNAPCVTICPTRALFTRPDRIVDFDNEQCIACRSCMAACPYDAIYIDPHTETAAKCNYCAHKVEKGLEPACVTVCPEEAIVAGDLDDPLSRISRLIATQQVTVRKPEKGALPKLYYIDGDMTSLTPGAAPKSASYMCAERPPEEVDADFRILSDTDRAQTTYDVAHEKAWGFLIPLYLWTKSLAAGPILVAALLMLMGYARAPVLFGRVAPLMALVLTFITTLLLIGDLERPERFLKVLFHPNLRSWLVWGAYILILFSGIGMLWLFAGFVGSGPLLGLLLWPALILAAMTAGYSAFLLAQAKARDLWQSRLLFPHLIVQAFLAGSAALALASFYFESGRFLTDLLLRCLLVGLCVHGVLLLSEIALPHGNQDAAGAVQYMLQGPLARLFWFAAVFSGVAIPIHLLAFYFADPSSGFAFPMLASALSLIGLLAFEDCFIRAGQAMPLT
jgi:Fe-S-cluster-containing dehydrogenase component/formate-dependent nitrite reductase membrane component NrfD